MSKEFFINVMLRFMTILVFAIMSILLPFSVYSQELNESLRKAAQKGQIEKVRAYLGEGASINSTDKNGRTALMLAAEAGHVNIVEILLGNGADITMLDSKQESALHKAINKGRIEVFETLYYDAIKKKSSIDYFREYLTNYPQGRFVEDAKAKLDTLYFEMASKRRNISDFEYYMTNYPQGNFIELAKSILDTLYFEKADYTEAYDEYLSKFPNGKFYKEADRRFSSLELLNACLKGNASVVEVLLKSGKTLNGYQNAEKALMSILQRQVTQRQMLERQNSGSSVFKMDDRVIDFSQYANEKKKNDLVVFKLLLKAGTNPNASKMKGGTSALEYIERNNLVDFKMVLLNATSSQ